MSKPISTTKLLIARAIDAFLIAALVIGNEDAKTFSFWIISMMVVVLFLGAFTMSKDSAAGMADKTLIRKAGRIFVKIAYVCALIYAGFPVLAALYAMSVILLTIQIELKSKQEAQS